MSYIILLLCMPSKFLLDANGLDFVLLNTGYFLLLWIALGSVLGHS